MLIEAGCLKISDSDIRLQHIRIMRRHKNPC